MTWIIFALVGPFFWTISNFIDKYAVEKMTKGVADYAFWGSIGAITLVTGLPFFFDINTPNLYVVSLILFAGFLLNYTYMFYGLILVNTDVSRVIPIYQLRSILVLTIGAILFKEFLSSSQLLGFFISFAGVLILSLEFENVKRPKLNQWTLYALMGTFSFAFVFLLNDFAVERLDIPSVIFYFDLGFLLASLSFWIKPSWRTEIIDGLRDASWKKFFLFTVNDIADETAQLFSKLALSMAPAAALVSVIQGIHSFYALLVGFVITIFLPHVVEEKIDKKSMTQKLIGAGVIFCGIVVINMF